jgi:hypothetical protein
VLLRELLLSVGIILDIAPQIEIGFIMRPLYKVHKMNAKYGRPINLVPLDFVFHL